MTLSLHGGLGLVAGVALSGGFGVEMARLFLQSIERWPTAEQVSVIAGVVKATDGEPLEEWIRRARELTLRGSAGQGEVLTATSQRVE